VSKTSKNAAAESKTARDRTIEIIAVLMLGVATVGSAWCGYQATRWNGEQARLTHVSTDSRVEASRLFSLATQTVAYDTNMVSQYAQAVVAKNDKLKAFYRASLIRPDFIEILDQWEAQVAAGTLPTNLLDDKAYLDSQFATYRAAEATAEQATSAGEEAGKNADAFVLTTLLLAIGLFFAGVTSSFRFPTARLLLVAASAVTLAVAAARLVDLPIV
jgi:hypothetical protein